MPRIQTEFYGVELPALFEKAIVAGQLLRLERMDRAEGEQSFAELNFFVGRADEERLDLPEGASASDVAEALFARHVERERAACDELVHALDETREGGRLRAVLELPPTGYRPRSRQVVEMRGFTASTPACLSSFVLEYDAGQEATYGPLARALLDAIEWRPEPFAAEAVERQSKAVWSIFDAMGAREVDVIRARYADLVRPQRPEPVPAAEPRVLDFTSEGGPSIDDALARELMGERGFRVRTRLFEDPIDVELEQDFDRTDDLLGILSELAALGPDQRDAAGRHAWEHCKLCFDVTDYGAPEGVSNEGWFGINGPGEAFERLGKGSLYLTEDREDGRAGLFGIHFYPPWENEHGCGLVVRDGVFVAWVEDSSYLGAFADSPGAD